MLELLEKKKKKSLLFGFTLIEMMIVIAIMTIITGTVIGFNRNSDRKLALYREARKVAYSLRQAQTLAMQAKTVDNKSTCSWKVQATTGTPYYELWTTFCNGGGEKKVETINLSANTKFSNSTSIIFDSPLGSVSGGPSFTIENTKIIEAPIYNTIIVNSVGDVSIQ